MFIVEDISIALGAVRQISSQSFSMEKGLWALVGRNGSGKSTFLTTLIGQKSVKTGQVYWNKKSIYNYSLSAKSKIISVVYTKPEIFGNYNVDEVIRLGRLPYQSLLGITQSNDQEIINNIINALELEALRSNQFESLSDGEKQLVMVGRALAQETKCIVLDEPTAFLDLINRRKMINLLYSISQKMNKLIIFSTHDVELISKYCNGLIWIDQDKIETSEASDKFDQIISNLFEYEI